MGPIGRYIAADQPIDSDMLSESLALRRRIPTLDEIGIRGERKQ